MPFPRDPNAPGGPERSGYLSANHAGRLGTQAGTVRRYSAYSSPKRRVSAGSSYPWAKAATAAQKAAA